MKSGTEIDAEAVEVVSLQCHEGSSSNTCTFKNVADEVSAVSVKSKSQVPDIKTSVLSVSRDDSFVSSTTVKIAELIGKGSFTKV